MREGQSALEVEHELREKLASKHGLPLGKECQEGVDAVEKHLEVEKSSF